MIGCIRLTHIFRLFVKVVNSPRDARLAHYLFIYFIFYYFSDSRKKQQHLSPPPPRPLAGWSLAISCPFISRVFFVSFCTSALWICSRRLCERLRSVSTSCQPLPLMRKIIEISRRIVYEIVPFHYLFISILINGDARAHVCVCAGFPHT